MKKSILNKISQKRDLRVHPASFYKKYVSTRFRSPKKKLYKLRKTVSEQTGLLFDSSILEKHDNDLINNAKKNLEPIGQKIIVKGYLKNDLGIPLKNMLIEIWQANSAGRYIHRDDNHNAPLDPNFFGAGRTITDKNGFYRFFTVMPGAYPWGNHSNAWRPKHIHFSILGRSMESRLATQMYFPDDNLLKYDPIFNSVPILNRKGLIAKLDEKDNSVKNFITFKFNLIVPSL